MIPTNLNLKRRKSRVMKLSLSSITTTFFPVVTTLLFPLAAFAEEDFSLYGQLFRPAFQTADDGRRIEALNSGLALSFNHPLLMLSLDYRLEGHFDEQLAGRDFAQVVSSSLRSREFNDLLQMDAVIKADSVVREEGESYRHQLTSVFSKPLADDIDLSVQYRYGLDKPSAMALEHEITDYSLGLEGELVDGRLSWRSGYEASNTAAQAALWEDTTKAVNFNSSYRIDPAMYFDVSGMFKKQLAYRDSGGFEFDEQRLAAGLSWAPTRDYTLSFKLNRREDSRFATPDVFGSGTITWAPQFPWQLELSYDEQLVEGLRGFMLRAKLDLDNS